MNDVTQQLSEFIAERNYEDLPDKVVHEAKRVFLDSIGCALGGMAVKKGRISAELARRLGGRPESSIIGTTDMVSCANAAFANGELINALDFDATLMPAIHVSPFVPPAALALGESRSASGKELIVALVLGHEVSCRVASGLSGIAGPAKKRPKGGKVVQPKVYGYSANAFGSAASAGKILNLDHRKMANALGIAGYNAPMQTSGQWHHSGTDSLIKYASAGWIAQAGATAALLAEMDYTGDTSVLDGEYGFWRFAGSEEWRPEVVVRNLGKEWHILNTQYKLYPCCGVIIPPLDLFTRILDTNGLTPGEIEHVKVWMHPLCEMPLWQNRAIDNEVHAQFSVAYAFAVAAHGIPREAKWQEPITMKSPQIRQLMDKVSTAVHPDHHKPALEPPTPEVARVEVTARGKTYVEERSHAAGTAKVEEPMVKDSDLVEKFKHNASNILPERTIDEAVKSICGLEDMQDVSLLMKRLARRDI